MIINACQMLQSDLPPCSFHTTVEDLVGAGYVFSRIDVNHWSTIMQGLVATPAGAAQITSVRDKDVQCCYEAIITTI